MQFELPYGDSTFPMEIDDRNILDVLENAELPSIDHPEEAVLKALEQPTASMSLRDLLTVKPIQRLAIVVTDHTRGCPYPTILPPLIEYIIESGVSPQSIEFLVATGTHPAMTIDQMRRQYGTSVVESFPFHCNDCRSKDMVYMGDLIHGNPFYLNNLAVDADFLITTGVINTHYLAGFSGGRKSILPGLSSYETIRRNHSQALDRRVDLARLDDNPIHLEMSQAASMANVDFSLNFILDDHKQIVKIVSGDIHESFLAGAEFLKEHYSVPCNGLAEVIITTPGGHPKDRTLYHTQKCMNNVFPLLEKGGTAIVFSPCSDGVGSDEMVRFMTSVEKPEELLSIAPEEITVGGHRAVATAKLMEKGDIVLVSKMPGEEVESLHFKTAPDWKTAYRFIKGKHGDDVKIRVIPNGNQFYGVLREET